MNEKERVHHTWVWFAILTVILFLSPGLGCDILIEGDTGSVDGISDGPTHVTVRGSGTIQWKHLDVNGAVQGEHTSAYENWGYQSRPGALQDHIPDNRMVYILDNRMVYIPNNRMVYIPDNRMVYIPDNRMVYIPDNRMVYIPDNRMVYIPYNRMVYIPDNRIVYIPDNRMVCTYLTIEWCTYLTIEWCTYLTIEWCTCSLNYEG